MLKPCTIFRSIFRFALFAFPFLLYANGEPTVNPVNSGPGSPDSLAMQLGHCNPITVAVVNCATKNIELSAFISWTFTGELTAYDVDWNTGQTAHKITVVPPGTWSWDPSFTSCEQNHWQNEYNQPGSFFHGNIDIMSTGPICPGSYTVLNFVANGYNFTNFTWTPENPAGGLTPYEVYEPGIYTLQVLDDLGCPFTDQIDVPLSPPVNPTLSGPSFMSPTGDTAVVMVNQPWAGYLWSNGETNNPITVYEPGFYEVTVTNQFGCTGAGSFGIQTYIPPPWTVAPTSRNHTIIIPDTLKFDALGGSLKIGDQIGVFYDSAATGILKCGGYAVWSGLTLVFPAYGNDLTPPAKNGFNSGELFKVKFWRKVSNQVFDATAEYAPLGSLAGLITQTNAFADDGVSMITSLTEGVTHAIPLNNGWNMISSYLRPIRPNMLEVFAPIASSVDIIKDGDGISCIPIIPINDIGNWNLLKGYQVRANQKDTLVVQGHKVVPEANPIPLHTGWQIIGYLRESPQNTATVFSAIQGQISLVKNNEGKIYSPQFGINTIGNMMPGQGYKVKALSNVTLMYQPNFAESPVAERNKKPVEAELLHFVLDSNLNTGNNSTIILTDSIAQSVLAFGDEIGVFTPAGILCGTAIYKEENLAITVWGDDSGTSSIVEGMKDAEPYQFKIWDISEQRECTATTSFLSGINAYMPDAFEITQTLMFGALSGSFQTAAILCFGETASISLNATCGLPPYQYQLDNGPFQSLNTFSGITPGTYTASIRDADGITALLGPITIAQPPVLVVSASVANYDVTLSITGGTQPYTFASDAPNPDLQNLPNGTYHVTVTDFNACTTTASFTVNVPPLGILLAFSSVLCYGGNNGSITVNGSGGIAPYEYSVNGSPFQTSSLFDSLSSGTYVVTVKDSEGYEAFYNLVIDQPNAALEITGTVLNNSINTIASGGTSPYMYRLNGGAQQDSGIFTDLGSGAYTVVVNDANGCTASVTNLVVTIGAIEPTVAWGLSVSPNPSSGLFELMLQNAPEGLHAEVIDVTGRILQSFSLQPVLGKLATTLDLQDLPQGTYLLRLSDGKNWGGVRLSKLVGR